MAYYFFVKDLKDGNLAEEIVAEHWKLNGYDVETLPKDRQSEGDIELSSEDSEPFTIEVKFDRMAGDTGNLCFEITNKAGDLTGIAKTTAKHVVYLVPETEQSVRMFTFDTKELQDYLYNDDNASKIKVVKGGDRRAYTLMLVSIENILKDNLCRVETISAELPV